MLARLTVLAPILVSSVQAQVEDQELLLNAHTFNGELRHFASDGTLIQSFWPGSSSLFVGAGLLPNGHWATVRNDPWTSLVIFDPGAGTHLVFDVPAVSFPADVDTRSDGTIVVAEEFGPLVHVDASGNQLGTWNVPGAGRLDGLYVDPQDEMWIADSGLKRIHHLDASGAPLGWFDTTEGMLDVVRAPDGTLWAHSVDCNVFHLAADGTVLGSFPTFGFVDCHGLALMADGTLWTSGWMFNELRHYDAAGTFLGSFPTPVYENTHLSTPRRARIGVNYCDALPNSTGAEGELVATGSEIVGENDVVLLAQHLPPNQFGYALDAMSPGSTPVGDGVLCLGSDIGRFVDDVRSSGPAGLIATNVDLTALPRPGAPHSVLPGETWYFTLWHRDGATSNFTDGVAITFH